MDNQGASAPSISVSLSFTFGSGPATNSLPALSWFIAYVNGHPLEGSQTLPAARKHGCHVPAGAAGIAAVNVITPPAYRLAICPRCRVTMALAVDSPMP